MNLPTFKVRASASGKLMINSRSKTETLSETTKLFLQDWLKEHIYGFRKEITSKYLRKGIELEDKAIDKAIEWLDLDFAIKNENFYQDDYFCGTPDLVVNNIVYDIKCSWDAYTFPLFENDIPNKDYFYQLQVYMHLTGCRKAVLTYVLMNTPAELIYVEPQDYEKLDKKYRIKTFEFDYDTNVIDELKKRVENAREYLTLINK